MQLSTSASVNLATPITIDQLRTLLDDFERAAGPDPICTARISNRKLVLEGTSDGVIQGTNGQVRQESVSVEA